MKERKTHMKIKVLLVMPGKEVQIIKIPASIKFIKSFIGKELQMFKINENTIIIANKWPSNDEFNRIYKENIILGTFIVVSIKNNHRVSMKKKDTRKFSNMFKLAKHEKKINRYKEEFLEEYYFNQRKNRQRNAKRNKEEIFNIAA
jgi:predicted RNA-binding protein with PUA domain